MIGIGTTDFHSIFFSTMEVNVAKQLFGGGVSLSNLLNAISHLYTQHSFVMSYLLNMHVTYMGLLYFDFSG